MKSTITSRVAIGAIAAALAAPAFAQDDGGRFGWLTRWVPAHTNTIDMVNGNDFRDNRDSTLSRNDVPRDQTTLANEPTEASPTTQAPRDTSNWHSSAAPAGSTALPATAVAEDRSAMTTMEEPGPAVDEVAQHNETIVNESPEPSLAAEHELGRSGAVSANGSDVTARNTSGIESVHDSVNREVYTGVEGAGGTGAVSAGREGEERMSQ
jgi:hypothetical protein